MTTISPYIKLKAWSYWTPAALLFGFYLYKSLSFSPHDFSNYYFPSYFLLKGDFGNWIFDPYLFNKKIFEEGFKNIYASFNPNPPFVAIFYIPFAVLPLGLSKLLFNIISILLFVISTHRLCTHVKADARILLAFLPVILFVPFRNQILFGQTYFLLFFLLAEGYMAYNRKQRSLFTIFWTLAIFLKVFPVIIFLFLALRKDWKAIVWLASGCFIVLIGSVIIQGPSLWKEFLFDILPANGNGKISAAYTTNYQSVFMLTKYLFIEDKVLNAEPVLNSYTAFPIALVIFKSLVLTICISAIFYRKDLIAFGMLMIGALLISPYGSTYSNILLLFPIIGVFNLLSWPKSLLVCFLVFLIANLPLTYFSGLHPVLQFARLYLTIGLFLMTFIFLDIPVSIRAVFASVILFAIPALAGQNPERPGVDRHFLKNEDHLLVISHGVMDGHLFYDYWQTGGKNSEVTNYIVNSYDTTRAQINHNQIYYRGTQLTFSDDLKKSPAVLNDSVILYLSDKGKGKGFYTLRTLPVDIRPE